MNLFEELWNETFDLELRLLVPVTLGLETLNKNQISDLMKLESSLIWKEND
jgi:hypothetical protein